VNCALRDAENREQRTENREQRTENREQRTENREWMVRGMRAMERKALRKKLDKEMRNYRLAGREENPTNGLLHAVREALRVPIKEIAEKMGVSPSNVFELEEREGTGSIMLRSLGRMAEAMGCKVVYGVVPADGKTLEALAEERLWRDVLGSGVSRVGGAS
jgi:transcriptional regulator with XRE-family HTH domain